MKKIKGTRLNSGRDKTKGKMMVYGAAVLYTIVVGFSFLAVKIAMQSTSPLEILTHRFNFAAIGAVVPLALGFIRIDISDKPLKKLFLSSGFYLIFMVLQAIGLLFATSIESGIFFAIIPILAKIIAHYYLGEEGSFWQNIFVCISIAAVIAMFIFSIQDFKGVSMEGLVLLFLASICMALSNVFTREVRHTFSPYTIATSIAIGGCLLFNGATLVAGAVGEEPLQYFAPLGQWDFALATAFVGLLPTFASAILMSYMLANMEAVKATIFGNLSTAISIVAGVVFLKEPLHFYHVVCTSLIIVGVIGTSLSGSSKRQKGSEKELVDNNAQILQ